MGRTAKPLIFTIEESIDGPTFEALRQQGHEVRIFGDGQSEFLADPTMGIFGPRCWRMDKRVAEDPALFQSALKAMREVYTNNETHPKVHKTKASKPAKGIGKGRKTQPPVGPAVAPGQQRIGETDLQGPSGEARESSGHAS